MTDSVVVLGGGYAGTAAVTRLQDRAIDDYSVTWIDDTVYHLVRHELHRAVRDPLVRHDITVPLEAIARDDTTVIQGVVENVDVDDRTVGLAGGTTVDYDYLVVAIGSEPAYYGIDGLEDHAYPLSTLEDALAINDAIDEAIAGATRNDPVQVVVGGGGLSGIQTAGEIARYRDERDAPIAIILVEALDRILPNGDPELRDAIEAALSAADVRILTNDPIVEATAEAVQFDARDPIPADVLVWTGGISGQAAVGATNVESQHDRLLTAGDFRTSDDSIFAVGDSALVDTPNGRAPPTAQAAIQSGTAVADNVSRAIRGEPLTEWTLTDRGTLVSVGETTFAIDVLGLPTGVVGGTVASVLKKGVAARWLATVTSWPRAMRAWNSL
ncbi:NADH dehydrogenase, FAD-containing subunit [Halanaeroarchaeum sp. HSR-CO]|uniref:NAD(P)/FAD-dependent oxidoreductase n=1 Tax=Halanaeroarchaeum sp. HSR-CO TaxID=2866382 RepID=UPI00217F2049|nr:FAD-dependent oxidoreductase [Halanaeroarchaeum sp. HSR-CO]UWG48200.1 NADH dehydrogenase, FAD-containing subunit [Halanaeroarchaeum sp. HSR-CO]